MKFKFHTLELSNGMIGTFSTRTTKIKNIKIVCLGPKMAKKINKVYFVCWNLAVADFSLGDPPEVT